MLSLSRTPRRLAGESPRAARRRRRGALAVSLAINAVVLGGFFHAATRGYTWADVFGVERSREVRAERIGFLQLPQSPAGAVAGRSGGDGQPVASRPSRPAPRLRAPAAVPDGIPAPAAPGTPLPGGPTGGSGEVIGEGGPTQGIRPSYGDPRVWARPGAPVVAPRSAGELAKAGADSVIAARIGAARDSLARMQALAAGQRQPGDWTVDGPGGKWGMDNRSIHLGKVSVPNAVLALLSSNFQKNLRGNPTENDYNRRMSAIRADLLLHAQREINEDEFRQAVNDLRKRKDRERAQRLAAQRQRDVDPPLETLPAGATQPR